MHPPEYKIELPESEKPESEATEDKNETYINELDTYLNELESGYESTYDENYDLMNNNLF